MLNKTVSKAAVVTKLQASVPLNATSAAGACQPLAIWLQRCGSMQYPGTFKLMNGGELYCRMNWNFPEGSLHLADLDQGSYCHVKVFASPFS